MTVPFVLGTVRVTVFSTSSSQVTSGPRSQSTSQVTVAAGDPRRLFPRGERAKLQATKQSGAAELGSRRTSCGLGLPSWGLGRQRRRRCDLRQSGERPSSARHAPTHRTRDVPLASVTDRGNQPLYNTHTICIVLMSLYPNLPLGIILITMSSVCHLWFLE